MMPLNLTKHKGQVVNTKYALTLLMGIAIVSTLTAGFTTTLDARQERVTDNQMNVIAENTINTLTQMEKERSVTDRQGNLIEKSVKIDTPNKLHSKGYEILLVETNNKPNKVIVRSSPKQQSIEREIPPSITVDEISGAQARKASIVYTETDGYRIEG